MATAIFWPAQKTNQSHLIANLFNFCIFYLILIKFGLGAKWVVLNHSGDFWMSFWTAEAFQLLLPTSNWLQSSPSSKLYDFFPVGESRLLLIVIYQDYFSRSLDAFLISPFWPTLTLLFCLETAPVCSIFLAMTKWHHKLLCWSIS